MVKIFAHRGASGYAPENTLPAFELAHKQGADGVELDVQLTKDGEVVVLHDEKIDRTSTGTGYVREYTLKELREFSFHNGMEEYRGVQIPLLKEVLEVAKAGGMEVNVELKTGILWYPGLEEKTAQIVREAGMEEKVIYSSFNHYSVQKMKELAPKAQTAYLYSDVMLDVEKYAAASGVNALHPAIYHMYMDSFMEKYKEAGMTVRVWTVNREQDMSKMIMAGVDALITNYPDRACDVRKKVYDAEK